MKRMLPEPPVFLVLSLILATSSCGFLFTHAPPAGYEDMDHFTCTEDDAGPALDVVWAGINLLVFVSFATSDVDAPFIVASGAQLGIWTASAFVGFRKTAKCRAARRDLASRLADGGELRPVAVEAVIVEPGKSTLEVGQTTELVATAYNSGGATLIGRAFVWSSSNTTVASVSAGQVVARAAGEVVITAETKNRVGTVTIVVRAP